MRSFDLAMPEREKGKKGRDDISDLRELIYTQEIVNDVMVSSRLMPGFPGVQASICFLASYISVRLRNPRASKVLEFLIHQTTKVDLSFSVHTAKNVLPHC
jgi:hypothetical protein